MNNQLQPLKGFRDLTPAQVWQRNWLKNQIIRIFTNWGYEPIETPTLEYLSLFSGQIGEDEKLFYSFQDNGGRNVALRYDQTVPTCRYIGAHSNQINFPFRRYQIQNVFRAEKPQAGRFREFLQCDADIFGTPNPEADAELIALGLDIFRQLGFPQAVAHINDRELFQDIPYSAISSIDKLDKLSESEVISDMESKGIPSDQAQNYLNRVKNIQPNETIKTILAYLKNYGFNDSWYKFSPQIARAFSYSQGPIWEIKIPGYPSGTVLGGERYDKLVQTITNQNIPATGFGLGFDRTLEACVLFNLIPQYKPTTQVIINYLDPAYFSYALIVASQLREQNINVAIYPNPSKNLKLQLKYTNQSQIPYSIIIGSDEIDNNYLTIKNFQTGDQTKLNLKDTITHLTSHNLNK